MQMTNDEIVCEATTDGICQMPKACSEYVSFENYVFKLNFTDNTNGNYLRIPLATFATNVRNSGGAQVCNIEITYLN
jgi:hypothetical protein